MKKTIGISVNVGDPVLLIAFNRPDHFARLIDRLRETARPSRIYVAIDGPRTGHKTDHERVVQTRALVSRIDWTSDICTLIQDRNLGCGEGVSTALNWFFENEARGIILEDDILPQESFFEFCSELLDRYQGNPHVLAISGCNFVPPEYLSGDAAYRFSKLPHIWGWATWREKWAIQNQDISDWSQKISKKKLWEFSGGSLGGYFYWKAMFDSVASGDIDTWDFQFVAAAIECDMLTATSNVNLVDNIGWGSDSTHTNQRPSYLRESENISLPLPPIEIRIDEVADRWSMRVVFSATTLGFTKKVFQHFVRR